MITPSSISIILHMIQKLNSIIVNYAPKVSKKYHSCTQCTGGSHIISYCGEIAEGDLVSYFKFAVSLGNLGQLEIMKILSRSHHFLKISVLFLRSLFATVEVIVYEKGLA